MQTQGSSNIFPDEHIHDGDLNENEDILEDILMDSREQDDISHTDALADFMATFYGPHEENKNQPEREDGDTINLEWAQLKKDGQTPLFEGAKLSR